MSHGTVGAQGAEYEPGQKPQQVFSAKSSTSSDDISEACICNRPKGLIVCKRCGFESHGRVQKLCPCHPKRLSLMDMSMCPECRNVTNLQEVAV